MMLCPYCKSVLTKRNTCDRCGEDVTAFKRLYAISNRYYNDGLAKAKTRNLTGAIADLEKSLEINRANTDARNLLGLIYNEIGETFDALAQWVISKNYQEQDNEADYFISQLEKNPTRLQTMNQVIEKYNVSLKYAEDHSDDLAIIQLKKILSLNPHYLKALQLISLLYIKQGKVKSAKRYLAIAQKVDIANPITVSYLNEIHHLEHQEEPVVEEEEPQEEVVRDGGSFAPAASFKEEKPSILPWINLILGIAIGVLFFMFAILPGIRQEAVDAGQAEIVKINEELTKATAATESLEAENKRLTAQIEELTKEPEPEEEIPVEEPEPEPNPIEEQLIQAAEAYFREDNDAATAILMEIDPLELTFKGSLELYNQLGSALFAAEAQKIYETGYEQYSNGEYESSLETLARSVELDGENLDARYFYARSFERLGRNDEAAEQYRKLIEIAPESERADQSRSRLAGMGLTP